MSQKLTESNIAECQAKFNLSYHVPYASICQRLVGFESKDVLEVGGSLPPEFVFDYLHVKSWSAVETPDYEESLKEAGGLSHTGTIIPNLKDTSNLGFDNRKLEKYNLFLENIENLPQEYYGKYDLIFSIATFEHIHKLPAALDKMFLALKPGGKLFSMFSPIWSAYDGHHLPKITDRSGKVFNFGNSPIPPWGHLLMRPPELCRYLYQYTDKETADLMVYYVYNSPHINRYFTEDYLEFIKASKFKIDRIELTFARSVDNNTQVNLEKLHPGRKKFDNNGILVVLEKNDLEVNLRTTQKIINLADQRPKEEKNLRNYSGLSNMDRNWQLNTPVCLIIFNRPDTTEKVFEAIREAKPPKLFVIADAPRPEKPGEAEKSAAARAIINRVDWECEVFTNYSTVNLGGRKRISSGLTWLFNSVEEAIVLEDDCLPHPTFFRFCQELLERYRDDERIMFISGDNFQFGRNKTGSSYYFSYYAHCWGWASWRRAWQKYDSEMSLWPQLKNADLLNNILQDNDAQKFWSNIFQQVYQGFSSWAYVWQFTCLVNNGLSILPNANLVSNIGFTSDASHTTDVGSKLANMPTEAMNFPLKHPPFIIRNAQADNFTQKTVFGGKASEQKPQETKEMLIEEAVKQLNANNDRQALMLFEEAMARFPNKLDINYGKAVALAKLGKPNQAVGILESLLAVKPTHKKAQLLLREIRPGKVGDIIQQATQALNNNRVDLAFNLLNKAKSLKQPTLGLDYLRAICFTKINQPAAAWQSLNEELRYFPGNSEAKSLRNQIQEQYPQLNSGRVEDAEFQELLRLIRPYTMLSEARLYSLFSLAKRVCLENIPGNFVECGVAAGGSTALMAAVIKRYSKQPRWLYAFDSFEGMPSPTAADKSYGVSADSTGWGTGTCAAPEASTREICSQLGVGDIVKTVKGYFQDTLPIIQNRVGMLALLHMDGDWYESTKAILNNLYDRVSDNGFIQVDDYGHWEGCRKAVHEFEGDRQLKFDLSQIDDTGVWFQCRDKFPVNPVFETALVQEFKEDDPVAYGIQSQMSRNERFQLYYALRQLLPETSSPLRFIEIGSFAGSSLFLNYRALKRSHPQIEGFAIDPGLHPQLQQVLQQFPDEVTHLKMFSYQAVAQLKQLCDRDGNWPPFIFVDGDHTYEGVRQDIADYFPLLAPGGIMVFHDYLPPLNDENRDAILFHHGGKEPGIGQACQELMENEYGCEQTEVPLLYPTDPTQSQAYLPIIPGVFSTIRVYRKPYN